MKNTLKLFIWMLLFIVLSMGNLMSAAPCEWSDLPECCNGVPSYDPCNGETPSWETPELCPDWCCWIRLNTDFPIIWKCISIGSDSKTNVTNAFPYMVWAITKIVMSLILVVCFIFVIYAGILRSSDKPKEAKPILEKVAITILLLWFSWVILKLNNPNFFG